MKKTINKLTKKNNKKTTYKPIRIIKQPNTNLTKGKPEKKRVKLQKNRKHQHKNGRNPSKPRRTS